MVTKIEDGDPLTFQPDFKPSNTVPIVSGSIAGGVAFYWDVKAVFQCDLAILRLSPLGGLPAAAAPGCLQSENRTTTLVLS